MSLETTMCSGVLMRLSGVLRYVRPSPSDDVRHCFSIVRGSKPNFANSDR